MNKSDLLYQIAFTLIKGIGEISGRHLLDKIESPSRLFTEKEKELEHSFGLPKKIIAEIRKPDILHRAEKELDFIEKNKIKPYFIDNEDYPRRLKMCADAPLLFYFKGNANLDAERIISVVGTRDATSYGKSIVEELLADIRADYPEALIVSGLASGIDIMAHRSALKESLPTVAVLAHGLDRIYPYQHRETAIKMLGNGGLLTEFMSQTTPERYNFLKRNRIIAGLADCTVIIESAYKGGALNTANSADSYNRDVFAFPGRTTDTCSQGCNKLIKDRKAALVTCAKDIFLEMNWKTSKPKKPVQKSIFIDLTEEEKKIVDLLAKSDEVQLNTLSIELDLAMSVLFPLLFNLEMKGVIRSKAGGCYQLI